MAERLPEGTDLRDRARWSNPRYPWHEWADGTAWRIRQGEDFDSSPEQFRRTIYSYASRMGLSAMTRLVEGDEKALDIQFFRTSAGASGAAPDGRNSRS